MENTFITRAQAVFRQWKPQFPPRLVTTYHGVWEITREVQAGFRLPGCDIVAITRELQSGLPYFCRFVCDVYRLGPWLLIVFVLGSVWSSLQPTIELYYSSQLIDVIQARLQGGDASGSRLLRCVASQIALTSLSAFVFYYCGRNEAILRNRIKLNFTEFGIEHVLRLDIPTLEEPDVESKVPNLNTIDNPGDAWWALEGITTKTTAVLDLVSQGVFLINTLRQQSLGPIFLAMAVARPFLSDFTDLNLWRTNYVQRSKNPYFNRLKALCTLVSEERFRSDIISDGLGKYIQKEFHSAAANLGDTSTDYIGLQCRTAKSVTLRIIDSLISDFPILLITVQSLLSPSSLRVSSIAILQRTAQSMEWSLRSITENATSVASVLSDFKNLYALSEVENKLKDGHLPYPDPENEKTHQAMEVEFKGVSFVYAGTEKKALDNVSFKIARGQLACIVGVNGSGKSSITKLLNRLFDPSEGQIMIDGKPLTSYKLADIRKATAILRQDHDPYPVSLRENVAFGLPDKVVTEEQVISATKHGGAYEFIQKLPKGLDTTLEPPDTLKCHFPDKMPDMFKPITEQNEKTTSISGGESQRLAASRTFMRLSGGDVSLLVADEPTSALDPQADYDLCERLKQQSGGRTVVYVTHRFGHLTRHADVILCMKDGCLVEQGTHDELLAKRGEYYRLHEVQARGFLDELPGESNEEEEEEEKEDEQDKLKAIVEQVGRMHDLTVAETVASKVVVEGKSWLQLELTIRSPTKQVIVGKFDWN